MIPIPPCPTEDSADCFWDATAQGNDSGVSFFNYGDYEVMIVVPDGHQIKDVMVRKDGLDWSYAAGTGYGVVFEEIPVDPAPEPTQKHLPTTGLDLTPAVALIILAVAVSLAGIALAWKGRKP